jgi:hypothetical protein
VPFNGSGVFTRLYSWTNDANNGLPISSTKFDAEDNDFASGFGNCLTRDNQGKPSAPLSWSQPLTLNATADGTVLTVARTGGANNPGLQVGVVDASGITIRATTGTITINAPVAGGGTSLVINGAASQAPLNTISPNSAGVSFGPSFTAGTTSADYALLVNNAAGGNLLKVRGDNLIQMGISGSAIQGYGTTAAGFVDMTPDKGSWVTTLSGPWVSGNNPTGTLKWERQGTQVTIWCDATIAQTATITTSITASGLPAEITPSSARNVACSQLANNSVQVMGYAQVNTNNTLTLGPITGAGGIVVPTNFSNAGSAGIIAGWSITYSL